VRECVGPMQVREVYGEEEEEKEEDEEEDEGGYVTHPVTQMTASFYSHSASSNTTHAGEGNNNM
jgi:hypothetical protein